MMKYGRLVWHRDAVGGSWSAIALDDQRSMYIITKCHPGNGWQLFQRRRRTGGREDMGLFRYLREAKLAADHQHHHRILNAGLANEALKNYVKRYPL